MHGVIFGLKVHRNTLNCVMILKVAPEFNIGIQAMIPPAMHDPANISKPNSDILEPLPNTNYGNIADSRYANRGRPHTCK
ncbi:hypothetical protein SERLADRAFT_431943 [Serpula lacrymans var. lacrymans S7.9]|uniref:Uncharacterized protein n=1 Tax=Serpula lacrymans var. lacrymans (strain S7.9) TaxID=578457 RepID=F8NDT3_SERL9|nr:uncharacterized protein SERLADRAFT_431943 [Serpula lacrymans var. lacrymans S7.9]EGO30407.1 hypothetical protein SERLADRAFT_431943 [Serpula lacrymans var. lacrymans S7.9]